ncbi:hypothetical protein LWI29_017515 [Acer saccharum]|uniref:Uncharacterized protein n=1 Tax=Acer saccharum TaxID=4024 RepID=A0AA39W8J9_ACESA|nr:hypothetical protein LWI29_017515 [Acer saccharum]
MATERFILEKPIRSSLASEVFGFEEVVFLSRYEALPGLERHVLDVPSFAVDQGKKVMGGWEVRGQPGLKRCSSQAEVKDCVVIEPSCGVV